MEAVEFISNSIIVGKAKAIKEYCKGTQCNKCVFYCGVCSLGTFHPCDWDFKNIEYGDKDDAISKT